MAVEVLEGKTTHAVRHDLESFYWILAWIALRHLKRDHPAGTLACTNLFDAQDSRNKDDSKRAADRKKLWLEREPPNIDKNPLLSLLLSDLTNICRQWVFERDGGQQPLDWY
jgi:hypothetical protein